jgi:hypothetical protein
MRMLAELAPKSLEREDVFGQVKELQDRTLLAKCKMLSRGKRSEG